MYRIQYRLITPTDNTQPFVEAKKEDLGGDFKDDFNMVAELRDCKNYVGWRFWRFSIRGEFALFVVKHLRKSASFYNNSIELRIFPCEGDERYVEAIIVPHALSDDCEDGCVVSVEPTINDGDFQCLLKTLIDNTNDLGLFPEITNPDVPPTYQHPTFNFAQHSHYLMFTAVIIVLSILMASSLGLSLLALAGLLVIIHGLSVARTIQTLEKLRGTHRKVVAPLIRDFLRNGCYPCNVTLNDTVFSNPNSPYFNDCLLSLKGGKTVAEIASHAYYERGNSLNWTMEDLLTFLCENYDIKWRFEQKTLKIRTRQQGFGVTVDATPLKACCEWNGEQRYSYGEYEHTRDGVEAMGNQAANLYDDLINYNTVGNFNQVEAKKRLFKSAPVRFWSDCLGSNKLAEIENSSFGGFAFNALVSILEAIPGSNYNIHDPSDYILLEKDATSAPKVISYNPESDLLSARAVKNPYTQAMKNSMKELGYDIDGNANEYNIGTPYYYNSPQPVNKRMDTYHQNRYQIFQWDIPTVNKSHYANCTVKNCASCSDWANLGLFDFPRVGYKVKYGVKHYDITRLEFDRDYTEISFEK